VPTILSHAIAAAAIGHVSFRRSLPPRFWGWTTACAMLPDADVIGFGFGIRYADMLGHRGLSHSFAFAAVVGAAVALTFTRDTASRGALAIYFAVVTASHPLLDALTNGGLGVALFAPFSNERYFFPWTPIAVSPIGAGFFSARGVRVLASEAVWLWLPSAAVSILVWLTRKNR
jgi:inner membrane protein